MQRKKKATAQALANKKLTRRMYRTRRVSRFWLKMIKSRLNNPVKGSHGTGRREKGRQDTALRYQ